MSQIPDQTSSSLTPPSDPGELPLEPKGWPKVIGIISIVWGSIGLICNGCGLIQVVGGPAIQNWAKSFAPPNQQASFNAPPPSTLAIASSGLGFVWSIVLIIAGSLLVARKPSGRAAHLVWAAGAVALWVLGLFVGLEAMEQMKVQMQQQATSDPKAAQVMGSMMPISYGVFGCIMLVTAAYPVFLLIWLGLVKRGTMEITEGSQQEPMF